MCLLKHTNMQNMTQMIESDSYAITQHDMFALEKKSV